VIISHLAGDQPFSYYLDRGIQNLKSCPFMILRTKKTVGSKPAHGFCIHLSNINPRADLSSHNNSNNKSGPIDIYSSIYPNI
jgi:hypothetical protein